jgi:3-oxoadipate enol-lactonase
MTRVWSPVDVDGSTPVSRRARLMPSSRVEVIPDCGHLPQVEQPDATAILVTEFLAS